MACLGRRALATFLLRAPPRTEPSTSSSAAAPADPATRQPHCRRKRAEPAAIRPPALKSFPAAGPYPPALDAHVKRVVIALSAATPVSATVCAVPGRRRPRSARRCDEPVHRAGHRPPQPATGHIAMPGAASRPGRPAVPAFRKLGARCSWPGCYRHPGSGRHRRPACPPPARWECPGVPPSLFLAASRTGLPRQASRMGLPRTTGRRSG